LEDLEMKAGAMRRKQRAGYEGIAPPQIKATFDLVPGNDRPLIDGAAYTGLTLVNIDWSNQTADDVVFEQIAARHVLWSGTNLPSLQFVDARLETCDLAAAEWPKAFLRRAEFYGCRLVGVKWERATIEDVVFKDCNLEYGLFWETSFKAVRFENCALREASLAGANLAGVAFAGCDLERADLRNTKLVGTDFRGSKIEGLQVNIKDLQGAIIDPSQAVHLAALLGMIVRQIDE
jgi:uncharacterized protein YjbI with pentapeptide repeats